MQHVSDTQHATFGLTVTTIINSVFEHSPDRFTTNEVHKVLAQEQLDSLEFLYGDITMKVCRPFILTNLIYIAIPPSYSRTFYSSHSFSSLLQHSQHSQGMVYILGTHYL